MWTSQRAVSVELKRIAERSEASKALVDASSTDGTIPSQLPAVAACSRVLIEPTIVKPRPIFRNSSCDGRNGHELRNDWCQPEHSSDRKSLGLGWPRRRESQKTTEGQVNKFRGALWSWKHPYQGRPCRLKVIWHHQLLRRKRRFFRQRTGPLRETATARGSDVRDDNVVPGPIQ